MKFDLNKDMKSWLEIINNNFKWSIALIIRVTMIFFLVFIIILIFKVTGLITDFKNFIKEINGIKVEADQPILKSKPSTPTYENDIKQIQNLKKLLKNKIDKFKEEVEDGKN